MKTLCVIGVGRESIPALERAKAMNLFIVGTDGNPDAPGRAYCDDFLHVSTYDVGATVAMARHYDAYSQRIDGVIALAADVPQTVARVAQVLRLPGISTDAAYLTSDKYAMKRCLQRAGVPIPWFSMVHMEQDLRRLVAERGYPCVLKPIDSRGARGVLLLREGEDLGWAIAYSKGCSPTGRVMLEEYLPGPQISTESVMLPDGPVTPGFIDRNYARLDEFAPHMIEDGGSQPSVLSLQERQAVCTVAERASYALGITYWTAKGDMVLTPDGPKVIEVAARLSGGYMSSVQIPHATGVDLVGAAIRLALGELVRPEEVTPQKERAVAIRYVFPKLGRITCIDDLDVCRMAPWIVRIEMSVQRGDVIQVLRDHTQRAGYVITEGITREQAVARARVAVGMVHVETERA